MISCNLCRFFWLYAIEIFIAVGLETSGASDKSSCPFYERGQFGKIAFAGFYLENLWWVHPDFKSSISRIFWKLHV